MVKLFKLRNYAIGAGLAKSEAILAAILGVAFFSESLSLLGWAGVLLGAVAVFLLSGASWRQLSWPVLLLGISSGYIPKFSKNFLQETGDIKKAISKFVADVKSAAFPGPEHSF